MDDFLGKYVQLHVTKQAWYIAIEQWCSRYWST